MPAQVPQASFVPLPPDFDIDQLVEKTPNFAVAARVSYDTVQAHGVDAFAKLVVLHVILGGKPLVIEGFQKLLPTHLFSPTWLYENHGAKCEWRRPRPVLAYFS